MSMSDVNDTIIDAQYTTVWGFTDSDGDGYADFYDFDQGNPGAVPPLLNDDDKDRLEAFGWAAMVATYAVPVLVLGAVVVVVTSPSVNRTVRSAFNPSVRVR